MIWFISLSKYIISFDLHCNSDFKTCDRFFPDFLFNFVLLNSKHELLCLKAQIEHCKPCTFSKREASVSQIASKIDSVVYQI